MKKILAFLLAFVMLLSFLVSCDDTGDPTGTENGGDQSGAGGNNAGEGESGESGKSEANPASDFEYGERSDGGIGIKKYIGTSKNVVIPSEINGLPVTLIGGDAFTCNEDIESVVVPDTVQIIVRWAFYACKKLKTVDFGEGVLEIQEHAFDSCSALEKIILPPKLETIGAEAFYGCSSATEIFIPKTLKNWNTSHGLGIFGHCTSLKTLVIEEGLENFGAYGEFTGANSLKTITFPKSLKKLGTADFHGVTTLQYVVFLGDAPETGAVPFGTVAEGSQTVNPNLIIYYDPTTQGWDETSLREYNLVPIDRK